MCAYIVCVPVWDILWSPVWDRLPGVQQCTLGAIIRTCYLVCCAIIWWHVHRAHAQSAQSDGITHAARDPLTGPITGIQFNSISNNYYVINCEAPAMSAQSISCIAHLHQPKKKNEEPHAFKLWIIIKSLACVYVWKNIWQLCCVMLSGRDDRPARASPCETTESRL